MKSPSPAKVFRLKLSETYSSTSTHQYRFEFYPLADDTNTIFLPADFLGNTSVTSLSLSMEVFSKRPSLVIDPLALRSSQNSLTEFSVSKFDIGLQTDFNFLNGINNLEELWISKITNFTAFQYLPPLPLLQKLTVTSCPSELNEIPFPDLSLSN